MNAPRPILANLDQFPYPDRTSLPIDYIESLPLDVPAVLSLDQFCTMQTSRGCPFSCEFCLSSLDIPVRRFPLDPFLGEIEKLLDRGCRHPP